MKRLSTLVEGVPGWLPCKDKAGFACEYRTVAPHNVHDKENTLVRDKSGRITPMTQAAFQAKYTTDDEGPGPQESSGMARLSALSEGSMIKKRTTRFPDGTVQTDEDLSWDDGAPVKKTESKVQARLSALTEDIKSEFPIGKMVKPLRAKKRAKSHWVANFPAGKSYPVIAYDELDGEQLLVLQKGPNPDIDYEMVYPDEVQK